jgi:hypothetical protein
LTTPSPGGLSDRPERWPVTGSEVVLETSRVISVRRDQVRSPGDGAAFTRDVVVHPGAVGIVALDDEDRVLLVSQYRHPVGHRGSGITPRPSVSSTRKVTSGRPTGGCWSTSSHRPG